jgi:cell wall-associated NlpC family hydrolase
MVVELLRGFLVNNRIVLALAAMAAIAALGWWALLRPGHDTGGASVTRAQAASADLPALPWQGQVSTESPAQIKAIRARERAAAAAARDVDPATGLPPASAGSNGSYTPPPPSERKHVYSATHLAGGSDSWSRTALQINRTAIAPPAAPDEIKGVISAANMLVGQPYRLGGGHGSWRSRGYDCSGAVSFALAGGGLVSAPMTSGQFMSWGVPGPGRWLTVYANPGHVYAVVAGLRWDTVGDARGSGPRWKPYDAYPQGFVARHFPGL